MKEITAIRADLKTPFAKIDPGIRDERPIYPSKTKM